MADIIAAENLCYRYRQDEREAVDGVSFRVRQGEFLCVLGRNGSGKSTLAKLLNALFLPTEGTLYVDGLDASDEKNAWEIRSKCGMVFQNPDNQLVATIVEEDVAFGLENLGVPPEEIRRRVDEALAQVGMNGYALSAPHMLSGGQKQRVAIAGVVAMRPRVIVFDEATAMLDPSGRAEVLKTARALNRGEGVTVVWITHFMDEAAASDRVLVMDEGKIALEGAPREVFSDGERLRELGLEAPEAVIVAQKLREGGLDVSGRALTMDELAEELCRLKQKG